MFLLIEVAMVVFRILATRSPARNILKPKASYEAPQSLQSQPAKLNNLSPRMPYCTELVLPAFGTRLRDHPSLF